MAPSFSPGQIQNFNVIADVLAAQYLEVLQMLAALAVCQVTSLAC